MFLKSNLNMVPPFSKQDVAWEGGVRETHPLSKHGGIITPKHPRLLERMRNTRSKCALGARPEHYNSMMIGASGGACFFVMGDVAFAFFLNRRGGGIAHHFPLTGFRVRRGLKELFFSVEEASRSSV